MGSKRNSYSAEFKSKMALLAIKGEQSINEIAGANGVHPNQIIKWKQEAIDGLTETFNRKRGRKPKDDMNDPDNLLRQIGQLNIEIDWLKKKVF